MVVYLDFSPTINKVICFANSYLSTSFFLLWRFWWLLWKELYLSTINSQNCCNLIVGLHVGITTDLDYFSEQYLRHLSTIKRRIKKKLFKNCSKNRGTETRRLNKTPCHWYLTSFLFKVPAIDLFLNTGYGQ
jgi:hypothetical protein